MRPFKQLDSSQLQNSYQVFSEIYASRPIKDNAGGMGQDRSWATWHLLKILRPNFVVESGVWKGHSTWLIEAACPETPIVCFDPNLERIQYRSKNAEYFSHDFSQHNWAAHNTDSGLCFFDDHQNSYSRLMQMKWFGFRKAIFEDNPMPGDGDFYSINHIMAGTGAPRLQMNPVYRGNLTQQVKRLIKELILMRIGYNQNLIVMPNEADKANMAKNLAQLTPIMHKHLTSRDESEEHIGNFNHLVYLELKRR